MYLEFLRGKATPTPWIIIDDFGTEHDVLDGSGDFGGPSELAYRNQYHIKRSRREDPDYFRASNTEARAYYCREAVPFTSAFGLSIEVDLSIDFHLIPAWDEDAGEAYETRESGARIEILRMSGWDQPYMVSLEKKALEDFCWAYINLETTRAKVRLAKLAEDGSQ